MKLLNNRQQLNIKIKEVEENINLVYSELHIAKKRMERRETYGIYSFINKNYYNLNLIYKQKKKTVELLGEYMNNLYEMLEENQTK